MHIIVGLGNPGEEYENTRHNTGHLAEAFIEKKLENTKGLKFTHLDTFMNKSGSGIGKLVKSKKAAEKLVVIHDDLDLPLGRMKIVFDRGSGGHRGVESIIRALKTTAFIRIRIGICPTTPTGKLKKPKTEKQVIDFILGEFKPKEMEVLKKVFKRAAEAVELMETESLERAMTEYN